MTPKSFSLSSARFWLPSKALSAFTYCDSQKLPFGPCKVPVTFKSINVPLPIVTPKRFCLVSARFWLPTKALKHLCLLCLPNSKMQSRNFHLAAARFQLPSKATPTATICDSQIHYCVKTKYLLFEEIVLDNTTMTIKS